MKPNNEITVMLARAGITQKQLAKMMKASQSNISGKINRYPKCNFDFIIKVAEICKYDVVFIPLQDAT